MPELSEFPSAEMQFDRDAKIVGNIDEVLDVANGPCTDLIVMSHGWNNDAREARELYAKLAASMRAVLNEGRIPALQNRKIALVGVLWPSKKFAEEDGSFGGAAGAGSPAKTLEVIDQINGLRDVFPDRKSQKTLDSLVALVPQLEDQATARKKFADQLRTLVNPDAADDEDATKDLLDADGGELMDRLAKPIKIQGPRGGRQGGAAGADGGGGAAGLGDLLRGPLGAAKRLLNFTTFFEMKARAGDIGARGVAPVIAQIMAARPGLKVHLLGHSFGARVVSASAKQLPQDSVASIILLQGAFSHHGFARVPHLDRSGGRRRRRGGQVRRNRSQRRGENGRSQGRETSRGRRRVRIPAARPAQSARRRVHQGPLGREGSAGRLRSAFCGRHDLTRLELDAHVTRCSRD